MTTTTATAIAHSIELPAEVAKVLELLETKPPASKREVIEDHSRRDGHAAWARRAGREDAGEIARASELGKLTFDRKRRRAWLLPIALAVESIREAIQKLAPRILKLNDLARRGDSSPELGAEREALVAQRGKLDQAYQIATSARSELLQLGPDIVINASQGLQSIELALGEAGSKRDAITRRELDVLSQRLVQRRERLRLALESEPWETLDELAAELKRDAEASR